MLHKHPSAEKAQNYFGISEKTKYDSANFFIYIQPKIGNIYDCSIARALDETFVTQFIRDQHLSHLSALLTGGIDHSFIEESHSIWLKYSTHGVTTGEYIKLYQLIISYLSGEAHKKYWWRYKKYRDLSRAVRNLLLFDLAIGTSSLEQSTEPSDSKIPSHPSSTTSATLFTSEELTELAQKSYDALHQGYSTIQEILEFAVHSPEAVINKSNINRIKEGADCPQLQQASLFVYEAAEGSPKPASNENKSEFLELISQTHKKIQKISKLLMITSHPSSNSEDESVEKIIQEVTHDIESIIKNLKQTAMFSQTKHEY